MSKSCFQADCKCKDIKFRAKDDYRYVISCRKFQTAPFCGGSIIFMSEKQRVKVMLGYGIKIKDFSLNECRYYLALWHGGIPIEMEVEFYGEDFTGQKVVFLK